MPRFGVRCRVRFDFAKPTRWIVDEGLVRAVVGALMASEFSGAFTRAGRYGAERAVKGGAAGVARALESRTRGSTSAFDAATLRQSTVSAALDYDRGGFEASVMVADEALAARSDTIIDELLGFVLRLMETFRPHGALLSNAHVAPEGREFRYPWTRPPVSHPWLKTTALVDVLDDAFHASGLDDSDPEALAAIVGAPVPSYATRSRNNGVVIVRFHTGAVDAASAGLAAGRHARWLSRALPLGPAHGFNAAGDADETPAERVPRPPFTFLDPAKGRAYRAISVAPDGEPDRGPWDEAVAALEAIPREAKELRLVVPRREVAVAIHARALSTGFGAVLYEDERNRLWNIAPEGWWIDDVDPEPAVSDGAG